MPKVTTYSKTYPLSNSLTVTIGSNGIQGGDYGHGGRTLFRLKDEGGTAWAVRLDGRAVGSPNQIEISLGGDHEAETLALALEFAAKKLREEIGSGIGLDFFKDIPIEENSEEVNFEIF